MAWQDLPKNQRMAVLVAVPLVLVGVFGYLAWQDLGVLGKDPKLGIAPFLQRNTRKNLYKTIGELNAAIDTLQKEIDQKPALLARLEAMKEERDELQKRMPKESQKDEVRRQIQELARLVEEKELGKARFLGIAISEPGANARGGSQLHYEVVYRCQFEMDMNGLIAYINQIENHERFMLVSDLLVTPGTMSLDIEGQRIDRQGHKVSMTIKTYVYSGTGG